MQRKIATRLAVLGAMAVALTVDAGPGRSEPATSASPTPRVVNVTSDSAAGWLPSKELEADARRTAEDYLAAKDAGRSEAAYAMLTNSLKTTQSGADFAAKLSEFNRRAGAVKERRLLVLTWTKDPADAPAPGVYLAIDLQSRFSQVQRDCGYIVLYQPPSGGPFGIAREEDNFITDADATRIEHERSPAALQASWEELSAHCPNYRAEVAPPPLPEQPDSTIGYPTVAAALDDLRNRPGVAISVQNGWTVASDPGTSSIWSFPPQGHAAYPAAVKRQVVKEGNAVTIQMKILCQASKAACDDLVRAFQQLNARASQELRTAAPAEADKTRQP